MVILAIDASLNCPGFAVVQVENRVAAVLDTATVDNRKDEKKTVGRKLQEIGRMLHHMMTTYKPEVIVRERGFSRFPNTTQLLFRVVGALDLVAYDYGGFNIVEVPPKEIKLLMTGTGNADKDLVADALPLYVGKRKYRTNDETDAVGVALAWALKNDLIDSKLVKKPGKIGRPKKGSTRQTLEIPRTGKRPRYVNNPRRTTTLRFTSRR